MTFPIASRHAAPQFSGQLTKASIPAPSQLPASPGDHVLFTGRVSDRSGLKSRLAIVLAGLPFVGATLLVPAAAMAAPSQAPTQAQVVETGTIHPDVTPNGQYLDYVDHVSDVAHLANNPLNQTVFDLSRSPLLSKQTRQELESFLDNYNAGTTGQMGVVVIPDTHQNQLGSLATDIGNAMGVGHDAQDDGLLMLINAQAVRENRPSGRMFIATGSGVDDLISDAAVTDLLVKHALPHLEKGDYDSAVRETVEAVTERLDKVNRSGRTSSTKGGYRADSSDSGSSIPWGEVGLKALYIISGVAAAGGLGYAGVKGLNIKRRREEHASSINNALTQMGSTYKAGPMNVYKIETAKNLLSKTDKQADADTMLSALSVVDANTNAKDASVLRQLYIDNGISHATPEVRIHAIKQLNITKTSRELFEPLMAQLAQETEQSVVDALESPLVALANETDVSKFSAGLDARNDGVRQVSVRVMSKFFKDDMVDTFFTRLNKEDDAEVIQALNEAIVGHADEKFSKTFLDKLKSDNVNVKGTAVEALGKLTNEAYFPTLLEAFTAEKKEGLDTRYTEALSAITRANKEKVSGKYTDKLYAALDTKGSQRIQEIGLSQLGILGESKHVGKLYAYLESADSLSPQQGIALLVSSSDKSNNALLLEKLGHGKPNVRMASAKALGKLADPANVGTLFTALEAEKEQGIATAMSDGILGTSLSSPENHKLLLDKLKSSHAGVRMTAVQGLGKLADPADLKALFGAMEKEANSDIANALMKTIVASGNHASAFNTLSGELATNSNTNVQLSVVYALQNHGLKALDPLFDALTKTNSSSPRQLTDVLSKTLVSLGEQGDTLNYMLKKADSRHELVQDVAATVASKKISDWSRQFDYDDHTVMKSLVQLSRHQNRKIKQTADDVYSGMVKKKLGDVRSLSSFSDHTYRSNRSRLQTIARNAFEDQVRNAASEGIKSLDSRKSAYDVAARAASAASANTGGGGLGGGGFRGGGGGI